VLPVIRDVLAKAPGATAVDAFRAQYRLQALKQRCDAVLADLDCVLTPSIPRAVTLAELERDPIGANSLLGHYTNFMNLLDYAAVATPAGFMRNGLPWGVTLFGRAFTDQYLLSVADALHRKLAVPLVGGARQDGDTPARAARDDRMKLVVCGAHLTGLPLNGQLAARGARLVEATSSAPRYRLFALAGGPVQRPGMMRDDANGAAIAVEVWALPSAEVGSFLAGIPAPLALGKVELADGRWETGFVCEAHALNGAVDITQYGGWRAWLDRAA
jgi:allophanate hydrolase